MATPYQDVLQGDVREKLTIPGLLRPHWKALLLGLTAVGAETLAGLLEPWPLKVVLDSVLHTKKAPDWLSRVILSTVGQDSLAILKFTALAVIAIAAMGAIGTYFEKQTITGVGQRVMHGLRRTFYWHIQRLSMSQNVRTIS